MALTTKSITGNGAKGHHYFVLRVDENSTNISNNTSSLSFSFVISNYGGAWDWYYWGQQISYSININGKVYSGYIPNYDGVSTITLNSGSLTVEHNSDGKKDINISFSVVDNTGQAYTCGNASASGTMTLTTIPRASSITGGSGDIGGTTTININRASSSFKHKLYYAFGGITWEGITGDNQVETSYTWTIPTKLYQQIPSANSGTGTIYCETYNGDTYIGTSTCQFTAKVTNSNPIAGSLSYKDNNSVTVAITGNNQRIIRDNSILLFTIGSATAKNSASISNYEITFNGVTKSRTSSGILEFGTINLSNDATATLKVTDSRGNTDTKEINVIIDDWKLPTALIDLNRKNNYYSETYFKVDATYSSLNNKNKITIQYRAKQLDVENYLIVGELQDSVQEMIELDNQHKWSIEVILTDLIGKTTYNLLLDRGMPIIFFDRVKSSVGVNCFPSKNNNLEVNGYEYSIAKTEDNIDSFNNVGEDKELNQSGFYTICEYQNGNGTWYNLLNVRHRNGQADGVSYGMQLRNRMTGYTDKLQIRQQNNGAWGNWRNIQEEAVVLYDNPSGTTGTITLSESAGNFQMVEIFYVDNNGRSNKSVKVYSPQQKNVELSCIEPSTDNNPMRTYIRTSLWIINGTSLYHDKSTFTTLSSDGVVVNNNQYIKINRVVGYR